MDNGHPGGMFEEEKNRLLKLDCGPVRPAIAALVVGELNLAIDLMRVE